MIQEICPDSSMQTWINVTARVKIYFTTVTKIKKTGWRRGGEQPLYLGFPALGALWFVRGCGRYTRLFVRVQRNGSGCAVRVSYLTPVRVRVWRVDSEGIVPRWRRFTEPITSTSCRLVGEGRGASRRDSPTLLTRPFAGESRSEQARLRESERNEGRK